MFSGQQPHAALVEKIEDLGLSISEDFTTISANTVIVHNPSVFKFETELAFRIVADTIILVMHENPINGVGQFQYNVNKVIDMIEAASFCSRVVIAPISALNRGLINKSMSGRLVADDDWFNIIDFKMKKPKPPKADIRGRHSRPGPEKWPDEETLFKCFPKTSENHILGADWVRGAYPDLGGQANLYNFGAMPVDQFLDKINFFIYFCAPVWRESFGRVVAEAIAAGKLVIGDKNLAETFGSACVTIDVKDLDSTIAGFIDRPQKYVDHVKNAQEFLLKYNRKQFELIWAPVLGGGKIACK